MSGEIEADDDPILLVTGLPAAAIIERVQQVRKNPLPGEPRRRNFPPRLIDLMRMSDFDFVNSAHSAILGRLPFRQERLRRLNELAARKRRIEIVARLMFSPEGRKAWPKVRGPVLAIMASAAALINRLSKAPSSEN